MIAELPVKNKMAFYLDKALGISSGCPAQMWLQRTMAKKDHPCEQNLGRPFWPI